MADPVRHTSTQTFDWGYLRWFIEPDDFESQRLCVAEATFLPGKTQERHAHYREEHLMYVLSGTGLHTIDGQTSRLRPGDIFLILPYAEHEIENDAEAEDLRILLVYSPSHIHPLLRNADAARDAAIPQGVAIRCLTGQIPRNTNAEEQPADEDPVFDDDAKSAILDTMERLSKALGLSLAMVDTNGRCIVKTGNHPAMCSALAEHTNGDYCNRHLAKMFRVLETLPSDELNKPHTFDCCHAIASTIIPVMIDGSVKAYMKCGEILLNREDRETLRAAIPQMERETGVARAFLETAAEKIPVEPKSRLYTAAEATFAITSAIAGMAVTARRQKELDASKLSLAEKQLATTRLEKALREADLKLLQSQITPHFLFNTLNTIALTSYVEGAKKATELTWSLSDLLRATLRRTEELIPLKDELSLLQSYIHIQKERFGDRITFAVEADPEYEEFPVPSLLLQPLVENAILHGFGTVTQSGFIKVTVTAQGENARIEIHDDGAGFTLDAITLNPKKIGLRSTMSRLDHYYGDGYRMDIDSTPGKGTRIVMVLPPPPSPGGEQDGAHDAEEDTHG